MKKTRREPAAGDARKRANDKANLIYACDESLSYYLDGDCPDSHIKRAMSDLVRRRLSEMEEDGSVNDARETTVPDGEALKIRWLIVVNPNTPPAVLDSLVNTSCPQLLERIAEHPKTSSVTLARLAFDPEPEVRAAVAENANTPVEVVWMLVRDESPDVRFRLAESYHLPLDVLHTLAEDENPFVAARARTTLQRIERSITKAVVRDFQSLLVRKLCLGKE